MNVVLYTDDMLPITVLDLSRAQLDFLERAGTMRLAVVRPLPSPYVVRELSEEVSVDTVDLWIEPLYRNGRRHWLLFTGEKFEENALLLPSKYLPGQRHQLERDRREAFGRGILAALTGMLGNGDDE